MEAKGALVTMLLYAAIFAMLWFAVYVVTLGRGLVG